MFIRTESFKEFLRFYPIVSLIVAIHIVLYLLTLLPILPNGWLLEHFSGVNLFIVEGEYWRLITPIFIHSGFAHTLFNSFSLVLFGPALERIIGKGRFILLYLATGIAANLATLLIEPLTYIHVGSSGAIFGLFGFFLAVVLFRKDLLSKANSQLILTIIIMGMLMTFIQPNINVTAHIFGLIAGLVIGAMTLKNKTPVFSTGYTNVNRWAAVRSSFKSMPLSKLIIWGGILILAIVGILF